MTNETVTSAEHWSETPISHLMHQPVIISGGTSLEESITLLQDPLAHCLLITDDAGRLKGLFTEEMVLEKVMGCGTTGEEPVLSFIDTNFFSLKSTASIAQVIDVMGLRRLRYLPLLDDAGVPVGIFSIRGLVNYVASKISVVAGEKTTVEGSSEQAFGSSQAAIIEVLNLPINFALSSKGYRNVVRLSKDERVSSAVKRFKGTGHLAALVFDRGSLAGLFRIRDIPFKVLHRDSHTDMKVSEIMTKMPESLDDQESLGSGINRMANTDVLFLHYQSSEDEHGLISGIGLISYLYEHIYEDE